MTKVSLVTLAENPSKPSSTPEIEPVTPPRTEPEVPEPKKPPDIVIPHPVPPIPGQPSEAPGEPPAPPIIATVSGNYLGLRLILF